MVPTYWEQKYYLFNKKSNQNEPPFFGDIRISTFHRPFEVDFRSFEFYPSMDWNTMNKKAEEAMDEVDVHKAVSPDELPDIEEEERAPAESADMPREEAEEGLEAAEAPVSKVKTGRSRTLPILLVILLLILGGLTAIFYFAPNLIPGSIPFIQSSKKQEVIDPGVARLSFKAVTGSFIQSSKAGQLFVIKGMVTNNYPKPRSFILLKGTILDDKGKVVKIKVAYAGNTFAEKQIKETPIEALNQGLKTRAGRNRMNLNLQPGATIPFMIIIDKLPENVSEFTVEAVSSSLEK